jgi:hypothetical protein
MGINTGALYIIFIMLAISGFAYVASGPTPSQTPILTGPEVVLNKQNANQQRAMLQLYNFNGVTITPPVANLCSKGGANTRPDIMIATSPDQSSGVSSDGQISLWVSDKKPPLIAPGSVINKSTGQVINEGETAGAAPDGFIWAPQLYVFPATEENKGKAYFPAFIKGAYNNGAPLYSFNSDVLPPNSLPQSTYTAEDIWNVSDIGLTDGDYNIEFIAHDGSTGLGVKCLSIRVYTPPETEDQQNQLPL